MWWTPQLRWTRGVHWIIHIASRVISFRSTSEHLTSTASSKSFFPSSLCSLLLATKVMIWQDDCVYHRVLLDFPLSLWKWWFWTIIHYQFELHNEESRVKKNENEQSLSQLVKGLLKSCNRKRFIILQTLLMFVSMLSSSCLSMFIFNRAIMCLPQNFAEEKVVKIYSQLGIYLCVLLMKIYFPYFHFKVATILLNITSKDCLYFFN